MSVYPSSRFSASCERRLDPEAERGQAGRAIELLSSARCCNALAIGRVARIKAMNFALAISA